MTSLIRPARRRNRRALASVAAALALGACSSSNSSDWEQAYKAVRAALDSSASAITLQQASAVPYATMGLRVDGGPEQMIVLAGGQNGPLLWTSAARIALETENGRVVRTSGLPFNLGSTVFSSPDPLRDIASTRTAANYRRTIDLPDQNAYSITLNCTMQAVGPETIKILGQDIPTLRVDETCRSPRLDWEFTNTFWLGQASGFVWRSHQFIHPKLGPVDTEILRPPG